LKSKVLHRNNNVSGKAKIFSSYSAFVVTTNAFPSFSTFDYLVARKRELIAFFLYFKGSLKDETMNTMVFTKQKMKESVVHQDIRKKVLRELYELIDGDSDPTTNEKVTYMEWFYLVSMKHSFTGTEGVLG
jgi:hypothetical protein